MVVRSPNEIVEAGMSQTDEIVRLKLQVTQQANFLKQAQDLLAEVNRQRHFYKAEHSKCITLLNEIHPRVLPPTKSQKARMDTLIFTAKVNNPYI